MILAIALVCLGLGASAKTVSCWLDSLCFDACLCCSPYILTVVPKGVETSYIVSTRLDTLRSKVCSRQSYFVVDYVH